MLKNITRRIHADIITFSLHFDFIGSDGSGAGFECDEHGNVDLGALAPAGLSNYMECITGEVSRMVGQRYQCVTDKDGDPTYRAILGTGELKTYKVSSEIVRRVRRETTPAHGKCPCGRKVYLTGFTNTCECGRDYNMSGSLLAPRSQWGEETGESIDDILRA